MKQISDLEKGLAENHREKTNLQAQVDVLTSQQHQLQEMRNKLMIERDEARANYNNQVDVLTSQQHQFQETRNRLMIERDEARVNYDNLAAEMADAKKEYNELMSAHDNEVAENSLLTGSLNQTHSEHALAAARNVELEVERDNLLKIIAEMRVERDELLNQTNSLLADEVARPLGISFIRRNSPGAYRKKVLRLVEMGFDAEFYYRENPDVVGAGVSAIEHYLRFGKQEGRRIRLLRPMNRQR